MNSSKLLPKYTGESQSCLGLKHFVFSIFGFSYVCPCKPEMAILDGANWVNFSGPDREPKLVNVCSRARKVSKDLFMEFQTAVCSHFLKFEENVLTLSAEVINLIIWKNENFLQTPQIEGRDNSPQGFSFAAKREDRERSGERKPLALQISLSLRKQPPHIGRIQP